MVKTKEKGCNCSERSLGEKRPVFREIDLQASLMGWMFIVKKRKKERKKNQKEFERLSQQQSFPYRRRMPEEHKLSLSLLPLSLISLLWSSYLQYRVLFIYYFQNI